MAHPDMDVPQSRKVSATSRFNSDFEFSSPSPLPLEPKSSSSKKARSRALSTGASRVHVALESSKHAGLHSGNPEIHLIRASLSPPDQDPAGSSSQLIDPLNDTNAKPLDWAGQYFPNGSHSNVDASESPPDILSPEQLKVASSQSSGEASHGPASPLCASDSATGLVEG